MTRAILAAVGVLMLAGCGGASIGPGGIDDMCRGAASCAPRCGSVATGASPECSPAQNEGRTRG